MRTSAHLQARLAFVVVAAMLATAAPVGFSYAADLATLTKWGTPEGTVRQQGEFITAYDGRTRCPRWTLESLTAADLAGGAEREDRFAADETISLEFRGLLRDYQGSGYDRGHLACAGNYGKEKAKAGTFLLSNMAPQAPKLNRGPWRQLETQCRELVTKDTRVWIVTVPLWIADGEFIRAHRIGDSQIWVPTHFGKAVLILRKGEKLPVREWNYEPARAWIAPNEEPGPDDHPESWVTTIDELETAAGLDLWSGLPDGLEDELEASK